MKNVEFLVNKTKTDCFEIQRLTIFQQSFQQYARKVGKIQKVT